MADTATALVLAAGQGTRMKSGLAKVLHPIAGKPMLAHVTAAARAAGAEDIVVVVGYQGERVIEAMGEGLRFVWQKEQKGTGHAVLQAEALVGKGEGPLLVLYGDTPLITSDCLRALLARHREAAATVTVLTTELPRPRGYGRIVRDAAGRIAGIVEEADATPEQLAVKEVNTGIYCFEREALFDALKSVTRDNAQGEYYLTDVIGLLINRGRKVEALQWEDSESVLGVNDRIDLARAAAVLRRRILESLMLSGVTVVDPASTYVDAEVRIGRDAVIHPMTVIEGRTVIGEGSIIGPGARIKDTVIGSGVRIVDSTLEESRVGDGATVGPYSHLRRGTVVGEGVKIGNYAEIKGSVIGARSKVSHHSYIGDARLGEGVNIGAGVVTVNYDGIDKHQTDVQDGAFIGCNVNLVAPVKVGREAYVAAGSTITKDVPEGSLAVARERQANISGWVRRFKRRKSRNDNRDS